MNRRTQTQRLVSTLALSLLVSACQSTLTSTKHSEFNQFADEHEYDETLINYLSTTELSNDVVRSVIATDRQLQSELEHRESTDFELQSFLDQTRMELQNKIDTAPKRFMRFFRIQLQDYDTEAEEFRFTDNQYWPKQANYSADIAGNKFNFRKASISLDNTEWVIPATKEKAFEIMKAANKDKKIPTLVAYKLDTCKYQQEPEPELRCYYKIESFSLYNESKKINEYTPPLAVAQKL
ncbi:hypothetical protein A1QO_03935 [Vibrio genomosp. F10 str. ZF-129]|uniref:Lipoprotein n=1 Tax=Vibrio genomosp. F10 str. ZF-129 TaxID=1187848 RepID=A0A1E5BIK5_9VIBR|nr:DUF4852 domain-containing protein [Vibrio genomosp. F10]OEE37261.1 hypothetical protein A1QO_03935 [Vibrio genomosp. F10 str. ZF-129]